MKKAVIYARFSCDKQSEQSIEGQLYDCYHYAEQHGITIMREYIDRAMTGKNDDRPSFQQMLKDSALREWEHVIVWKLDRFSRNTVDSALNRQILSKNGVSLLSVMESFGEDASGQMMTHIIEAINEYYSADLREKTIRGMRQSALKAQSTGHIPLGYKVVDKKLVIDEETRAIPETVFRMYAAGERLTDIADQLNTQGYRTKQGKKFTTKSFYAMLSNEKYIGVYKYQDIEIQGGCPQMIPNEVFEAVRQKLIDNRKRAGKNTARADYILSGKLFCGYCGEPMSGLSGKNAQGVKYCYYRCNGVWNKTGCHKKNEPKDKIEADVCLRAREAFEQWNTEETAREMHELYHAAMVKHFDYKEAQEQVKDYKKQAENVINAIAKTGGNDMLCDKLQELQEQIDQLESTVRVSKAMCDNVPSVEQLKTLMQDILDMDISTLAGKKSLVDIMISKVFVFDDKLTIVFRDKNGSKVDVSLADIDQAYDSVCDLSGRGSQSRHIQTFCIVKNCMCITKQRG